MTTPAAFRCTSCGGINRVAPDRLSSSPRCGRCKTPLDLTNAPHELDDDALDRLIRSAPVTVLVDFWAPWCGPCRMVAPHLKALATEHAGRLIVAKINTDTHQRTAGRLSVRSIPTLAIWRGGELKIAQPGALMGPQLRQFVAPHLL
ncbi:MAG: thioredoxin 2 [Myxococcota bacterium]